MSGGMAKLVDFSNAKFMSMDISCNLCGR